jgi:hypothetical protein
VTLPLPTQTTTAARRLAVDSVHTLAYPLVSLADRDEEFKQHGDLGTRFVVRFPLINWNIQVVKTPDGKLASTSVVELLATILSSFHGAGMPEDGVVTFSRYALLKQLGWVGSDGGRPNGQHYKQLTHLIQYLQQTLFTWEGDAVPDLVFGGKKKGTLSINLLSGSLLAEDARGRKSTRGPAVLPPLSYVRLSPDFVRLLRQPDATIPFDLDGLLALPGGAPRVLFRLLTHMRATGRTEISIPELFNRIGSSADEYIPARVKRLLGKSHEEMIKLGVLQEQPRFAGPQTLPDGRREYVVIYNFGPDYTHLTTETEQLIKVAQSYGVSQAQAARFAESKPVKLREVLTAIANETVKPRYVPGFIVSALQNDWAVLPSGAQVCPPPASRSGTVARGVDPVLSLAEEYEQWYASEKARRIASTGMNVAAERNEIMAMLGESLATQPPTWQIDRSLENRINQKLDLPTFAQYVEQRSLELQGDQVAVVARHG